LFRIADRPTLQSGVSCDGVWWWCAIGLVRYRDCARFTLCAIGTWAIGLVRYRELCQFFVCYWVGALSHRALTEPARFKPSLVNKKLMCNRWHRTMLLLSRKAVSTDPSSVKRILPPSFCRRLAAVGSKECMLYIFMRFVYFFLHLLFKCTFIYPCIFLFAFSDKNLFME